MQLTVKITSYDVQPNTVSIKVSRENDVSPEIRNELNQIVKKTKRFKIGGVNAQARINAIKLTNTLSFTILTLREQNICHKLYELIDNKDYFDIYVNSDIEDSLIQHLDEVSKLTACPKGDIVLELSSFQKADKSGAVPGKKSVYDLSPKHQTVVLDKLKKMLAKHGGSPESNQ